jgi:hypothetical protein
VFVRKGINDVCCETRLLCPVCKFDYSHIREAFTRFGTDELEGGRAYPRVVFVGECGHAWQLIIQQHKGNSFVHVRYAAEWDRQTPTEQDARRRDVAQS